MGAQDSQNTVLKNEDERTGHPLGPFMRPKTF